VKSFTFTLPEPPSANRWWRTAVIPAKGKKPATVNTYLSKEAREYKANIGRVGPAFLVDGPVALDIDWYRSREAGDLDKRLGVALDAMQGVFYHNDEQVVYICARRFLDRARPRLDVRVRSVDPALIKFASDSPEPLGEVLDALIMAGDELLRQHPDDDGDFITNLAASVKAARRILKEL
jgi:Holliday junction resolvase RusA-like endonuclease